MFVGVEKSEVGEKVVANVTRRLRPEGRGHRVYLVEDSVPSVRWRWVLGRRLQVVWCAAGCESPFT